MVKVTYTLLIERPAEEVFAALTDLENTPNWQPQVIEEKLVSEGPLGVGSRIYQARWFRKQRIESTSEVVVFEPNRRWINVGVPRPGPKLRTEYLLEPQPESTRFTFSIQLDGKGFFRLISPLIQRSLQKDVETRFQTLKHQLEAINSRLQPAA